MNKPIHDDKINKVLLKPRFRIEVDQKKNQIIDNIRKRLSDENCNFRSQIANNHIIIDVAALDEHYWSPQLTVEVIKEDEELKYIFRTEPKNPAEKIKTPVNFIGDTVTRALDKHETNDLAALLTKLNKFYS